MRRGQPTRLGSVLLIIAIVAIVLSAVLWATRTLFSNDSTDEPVELNAGQQLLNEPTDQTAVRMSVRGPIVASEQHYSIVITISQSSRSITTYRGYEGEVIETKTLPNTAAAFSDLLSALNRASYMEENTSVTQDPAGICAVGQLIQFEMLSGAESVKKLWTTSCRNLEGTFNGLESNVERLLIGQIPEAQSIINRAK